MRIRNYNDLEYAAAKKLAVYCPGPKPAAALKNPKPASFVMNMDVRSINRAINTGLFIYIKENIQPRFFEGPGGALMCDRAVKGLTTTFPHTPAGLDNFKYYGSWNMVGESMTKKTMISICHQFNGIWTNDNTIPF